MKRLLQSSRAAPPAAVGVAVLLFAAAFLLSGEGRALKVEAVPNADLIPTSSPPPQSRGRDSESSSAGTVELSAGQLQALQIGRVQRRLFAVEKEAVGQIAFDGNLSVQVFPPYQGTISNAYAELGDEVAKGQALYSVNSPDLIQAESALISAAANAELADKELARVKGLYAANGGLSQKDLEQAISAQQIAEGSLKAARDAVRLFGKTEPQIGQIIASRRIDPALTVRSPIAGRVTAKNAQPGLWVQPGNGQAPYSVANLSIKWMLASVIETDIPLFHPGEPVQVTVLAYPGRVFHGRISKVYATVDPLTHRATIRSEIGDPNDELRPGMLADFRIEVAKPLDSLAVPADAVVREGDGTMTAWVTTDRRRFQQRIIRTGLRQDGRVQILGGLRRGEAVVTGGAIFLDNVLQAQSAD